MGAGLRLAHGRKTKGLTPSTKTCKDERGS
ncbi:hypothetical protein SAMN05216233_1115 [Desulfoluna spongiiphila]|uniref:Uncharacterized protein n=1 Tax=Desulfoluna spongiiphila TaxID=419481 RepID=A0A1G5GMI1_9BACT|nr:hypothetical protein SAMN05216233_1115 [Desulfoluna spongiiphila]VVS92781.1 consensus disorder prediction [Desulfoluna spongiiphila]